MLCLKWPANLTRLSHSLTVVTYIRRQLSSWLAFAKDMSLNLSLEDIIFVRGFVKASDWEVAAWKAKSRDANIKGGLIYAPGTGFSTQFSNAESFMSSRRWSPNHNQSLTTPTSGSVNQCLFLQCYKMKHRLFGPNKIEAAAGPSILPDCPPEDQSHSLLAGATNQLDHRWDEQLVGINSVVMNKWHKRS